MAAFNQVLVLFFLILIGYTARKKGVISRAGQKEISALILNVTLPALIIKSMQYPFTREAMLKGFAIIGIAIIFYTTLIFLSRIMIIPTRESGKKADVFRTLLIFSNVGFMGYPVVMALFGEEGVFYAALFNSVFDFLCWTVGAYILSKHGETPMGRDLKHAILNPGTIAVALGLTFFITGVRLEGAIKDTVFMLGSITPPLAMLIVGCILGGAKVRVIFKNWKLFYLSFWRLIGIPGILYLGLKSSGLTGYLLNIPVIISAMPSAANIAIFAERTGSDSDLASQGIFLMTILSLITIPLVGSFL